MRFERLPSLVALTLSCTGCPFIFDPEIPDASVDPGASDPSISLSAPPLATVVTEGGVPDVFEVMELGPPHGPTGGGTQVVLVGTFPSAVVVLFDDEMAVPISATSREVVVQTPPHLESGWVDVTVATNDDQIVAPDAFQFWPDATGFSSIAGSLVYEAIVNPILWTRGLPDARAYGHLGFMSPSDYVYGDGYAPIMGDCRLDHPSTTLSFYETGASELSLVSGKRTASLAVMPTDDFDSDLAPDVDVQPGGIYDLLPVAGNGNFPTLEIPDLLEVPAAFGVAYPDLTRSPPAKTAPDIHLEWTGGGGDGVIIRITWLGVFFEDDVVTCLVPDTGSFTIPAEVWTWPLSSGAELHVQLGRFYETPHILPHDNGNTAVAGLHVIYGLLEVR